MPHAEPLLWGATREKIINARREKRWCTVRARARARGARYSWATLALPVTFGTLELPILRILPYRYYLTLQVAAQA